ncbi:MAG TPA: alpha-amylase family glycosyl hydrolase [Nitrospiraceae bacterium]|nr:alpha-amylase family glycosyl hydrolase [Nitrospiraceae bacterium]
MIVSAQGPILQYYESPYAETIDRIADVFMAGYGALWLPPTNKAKGGQSVGYDVFDRFQLDDTFYGNSDDLKRLVKEAHRAGLLVWADIVLNHNASDDLATPGYVEAGDYPGFVLTLPDDIDGDFHGAFEHGTLKERVNGLVDIAQEKNHRFIRHPVDAGDTRNIPKEQARPENRQFYPDIDFNSPASLGNTSADRRTPSGFNLDHPSSGDPLEENAAGLLLRYCKWMIEVVGVDGFRLDAAKHVPDWFWRDFYDPAVHKIGPGGSTPFSFGEVIEANDNDLLRSYARKDGFGNRDLLDFPLYYTMKAVFDGDGFGIMRNLEKASVDRIDGDSNDGSFGVTFVQNHDALAPPPKSDNIAYAHILTRTGYPIVYFNALGFGVERDFPIRGRGDALGGEFGNRITTLVDIHNEYARGRHVTRLVDDDVYVYERDLALLVGLNDNRMFDADRNVQTSFPEGTTLIELTGNPRASNRLVIGVGGRADITIPNDGDGRGYAMWGLKAPQGATEPFTISPVAGIIPPEDSSVPNGIRRVTPIERVTADFATIVLTLKDEDLDDNALIRIDNGQLNVIGTPISQSGAFAGFQSFSNSDPGVTGQAVYKATLDLSRLDEGRHYIEAVVFLKRSPGLPPIFQTFRKVIEIDR